MVDFHQQVESVLRENSPFYDGNIGEIGLVGSSLTDQ